MSQLLVNKFTVLEIETNIDDDESIDISFFFALKCNSLSWRSKWKKKLSIWLSTSMLAIYRTSIYLTIELSTIDTSKLHSIKALLDSRAIKSFIDYSFICFKKLNTQTILYSISVFNIDNSPNKAGKISEVIDILLQHSTYLKRIFLTISDLGKQDLILEYNWLKDYNPRID